MTDIHYGPDRFSKKGDEALNLLTRFVQQVNSMEIDLVVDLGDRISNFDNTIDSQHLSRLSTVFRELKPDIYHLVGNHDVVHMTVPDQELILKTSLQHHSLDLSGWHLVFWNASCMIHDDVGFRLEQEDLDWLETDLSGTTLPTVLFSHMPLYTGSMVGNRYFEKRFAGGEQHRNASLARELVEKSEKVIAVISGHLHWNQLHFMDGIPHFTLQSITETFTTHPHCSGAWGLLKLEDSIEMVISGRDPMKFNLPVKSMAHHWLPPLS